ncbi:MAG: sialate O-acetylesterase, partial [Chryseobacterium sp.]
MSNNIFTKILGLFLLICSLYVEAKIKLPALVSDGMVLQRNQKLNIWGKADANEKVEVKFLNKSYKTTADQNGNWKIVLPEQKAGGPYTMTINEITLKDILIGDVWLASGQSNMELPMRRLTPLYSNEIKNANNQNIRFFTVPQKYNFKSPQTELDGGKWEATNPQTILNFSGVAYFFAKDISEKEKVAVGIIHSSLGGSPIQAWMDENSLKKYPEYLDEAKKWQNDDLIKSTESSEQALSKAWYAELDQSDIGLNQHWEKFDLNDSDWKTMQIPGSWEDKEGSFEGSVWFRKEITLTKNQAGKAAFLNLGRIKDADITYINGTKIGNVTYEYPPRWYEVPTGILKEG